MDMRIDIYALVKEAQEHPEKEKEVLEKLKPFGIDHLPSENIRANAIGPIVWTELAQNVWGWDGLRASVPYLDKHGRKVDYL